jgi:hypothetical protein
VGASAARVRTAATTAKGKRRMRLFNSGAGRGVPPDPPKKRGRITSTFAGFFLNG